MLQLPPFRYALNTAALYAGAAVLPANLDLDFTTMSTLDPRITFSRASTAAYFNSSGVLSTAASGAPRFDYDPVTLVAKGLLMELQRLNGMWFSEDFTNANWTKTGVSVLANQTTAPSGAGTADLITASATSALISQTDATTSGQLNMSVFAKKGTSDWIYVSPQITGTGAEIPKAWFNLATGVVGTVETNIVNPSIQNVGNGWYRCSVARQATAGTENLTIGLCDANGSAAVTIGRTVYLWGAQSEPSTTGNAGSSYIPVLAGADITRQADTAAMTGSNFSAWYNATSGTLIAEFDLAVVNVDTQSVVQLDAGSISNYMSLYSAGGVARARVVSGSVDQANLNLGSIAASTTHKVAIAYAANDIAACLNGGAVQTDTVATIPVVNQLRIGYDIGNVSMLCGRVRRIRYFNTRKTNAELQALTT